MVKAEAEKFRELTVADGDADKIFMPFEASAALGSLASIRELWGDQPAPKDSSPGY